MASLTERSPDRGWLALALLLAFPSAGFVQKYAGLAGVAGYVAAVVAVVFFVRKTGARCEPWCRRHFRVLAVLGIAGLAVGFVVLHPIEDRRGPGKSSDRDEGLNLAVTRMAEGKTPYYPPGKEAGPLSVLPGSIALAAPFVGLGDSAWQNLFWLPAFLALARRQFKNAALALALFAIPLALSPAALYEFVSGGDLIANAIFVTAAFLLALRNWSDLSAPPWHRWLVCMALGVALASRANFILLAPLFGAAVWRAAGPRHGFAAALLAVATAAAITLPFYQHDPAGFTPLLARQKLAGADHALPWAGAAIIAATLLAAMACAGWLLARRGSDPLAAFFRGCTLVTLTPMVGMVLLSSAVHGRPDFSFLSDRFGLMYVFFALVGWGGRWFWKSPDPV